NQAGIIGVLEDDANPLNFIGQTDRARYLGDGGAETAEVVRDVGVNGRLVAKSLGNPLSRRLIFIKGLLRNLAGLAKLVLISQELIADFLNGDAAPGPGCPAGEQFVFLVEPE